MLHQVRGKQFWYSKGACNSIERCCWPSVGILCWSRVSGEKGLFYGGYIKAFIEPAADVGSCHFLGHYLSAVSSLTHSWPQARVHMCVTHPYQTLTSLSKDREEKARSRRFKGWENGEIQRRGRSRESTGREVMCLRQTFMWFGNGWRLESLPWLVVSSKGARGS